MSADRETNHDMATHRDIALLLAEAADEVEIGIAPYQAVVRGGRRRKTRRWAVASAAALVIAGSTGALALARTTDDGGDRVAPVATQPPTAEERHVYEPQRSTVARGVDHGKEWFVTIDVWGAPKNAVEAQNQRNAMSEYGVTPTGTRVASDLIGKGWVFGHLLVGDGPPTTVLDGAVEKGDSLSGKDIEAFAMPLESGNSHTAGASHRLVIGKVAPTAQQVTCTWNDGTTIKAERPAPGTGLTGGIEDLIRPVDGSQPDWFVCLGAEGKSFKSVKVTK
ncbi:hypothetical protein GCM10011579_089730 [Streptomyces albiflavescens]|uniref:Uncharacterized protein n=1 Tax=Streptomyces albiflavescens TaxID=1623582 RepID=A0A917YDP6_9ACTN|nr:hypothetical protein [Streptomyces albiflavescens]GGN92192.1 hypothetical protein GCM10011579_089730 [Streptomyces albiflavescens]